MLTNDEIIALRVQTAEAVVGLLQVALIKAMTRVAWTDPGEDVLMSADVYRRAGLMISAVGREFHNIATSISTTVESSGKVVSRQSIHDFDVEIFRERLTEIARFIDAQQGQA